MTGCGTGEHPNPQTPAAEILRTAKIVPSTAIVLGSGLAGLASIIQPVHCWNFSELPGFARATAIGHPGRLILGFLDGEPVVAMQGRLHFYEGHSLESVVYPMRVMHAAGARRLLLSNAAGGINPAYRVGDLMILRSHINLIPQRSSPRQPDLPDDRCLPGSPAVLLPQHTYDDDLRLGAVGAARQLGLRLQSGVYAAVPGPNYETRAEIRMLRGWGVDAVGMSTAPEAVVGAHLGMRVLGVSVITNECRPDSLGPVSETMVVHAAASAEDRLASLVRAVVALPSP